MSTPSPSVPTAVVKAGHVQPLWAGHPWVFRQAVARIDEGVAAGDDVLVLDPHGKVLGRGLYSPGSAIAVRMFTCDGGCPVDAALLRQRVSRAVKRRLAHGLHELYAHHRPQPDRRTTGYRLVHAEGDGLPGLIVDVYDDVLVLQIGIAGLARMRDDIVEVLRDSMGPRAIIDRTPAGVARAEGIDLDGEPPRALSGELPAELSFVERGLHFELPLDLGQKTGFYFDQRPLRERIELLARGCRVLDGCCYVGAIGLSAARGGAAEVLGVDKSASAVAAARHVAELNELGRVAHFTKTDVHEAFRDAAASGGYDIVICDPPKLAKSRRGRGKALNAYRKLAAGACAATSPGGVLAFCCCSGVVGAGMLQRSLALGARDVDRRAIIFDRCFQGPDHPVLAPFPEGLYLKVLMARIEAA